MYIVKSNKIVKSKTRTELLNARKEEQRNIAENEYTRMRNQQLALAEKLRPKTPIGHPCGPKVKNSLIQ